MNLKSDSIDRLFEAIMGLDSLDECYKFFEDLCTVKELRDMSQRLEAASLLYEGKNYLDIAEKVGISTATISRVSRCVNYGTGGYKSAIERLKKDEK